MIHGLLQTTPSGFVVAVITDTTFGPGMLVSGRAWEQWKERPKRRQPVLSRRGVSRTATPTTKTFCEDAYGPRAGLSATAGRNRNRLTTDAVARLSKEIRAGRDRAPAGTQEMLGPPFPRCRTPVKAVRDVTGARGRRGWRVYWPSGRDRFWSKSGDAYGRSTHLARARRASQRYRTFVLGGSSRREVKDSARQ
jgi:hypothetical protein